MPQTGDSRSKAKENKNRVTRQSKTDKEEKPDMSGKQECDSDRDSLLLEKMN